MSVLLYDTSGAKDVCINEFLVVNGYCQSAGLGYEIKRIFLFCFVLFVCLFVVLYTPIMMILKKKRSKCS